MRVEAAGRWHCQVKELLQNAKIAFILRRRQQGAGERCSGGLGHLQRQFGCHGGIWLASHGGLLPK